MAANTRPYFIKLGGVEHMVEAPSPAAAIRHVVQANVEELRPARGSEVLTWTKANKPIQIAGEKSAPAAQANAAHGAEPKFEEQDAAAWIGSQPGKVAEAAKIWREIVQRGEMTLDQFDRMRVAIPTFTEALTPVGAVGAPPIDDMRSCFEGKPEPLASVIALIGDRVRHENFVDEATMPEVAAANAE